jgi:AraC-like DNA-binding protein
MTAPAKRVPVRYFALLRDALQAQGVDCARLLQMAHIEPERFEQHDATLLPREVEDFVAAARRLTGRTDLGFELGRLIKMTSHDLLGLGMLSCRNFDELLRLVSRHYHLMVETFTLSYRRTPAQGEAVYTPATAMPLEALRFYYEAIALSHQNQMALMLGPGLSYDLHLAMPEPPHVERYRALAPVRFHFDERALPGVRAVMGAELLDRLLPLADARALQQIDERCRTLGQRPPPADEGGWGDYVKMMLREARGEFITLDELAQRVNVSARTIDRHLKKENLQFRDLSQQVRFERACELLAAPGATVAQVALNLGFSDAANFSRAFRRVMGQSPSEFAQRSFGEVGEP